MIPFADIINILIYCMQISLKVTSMLIAGYYRTDQSGHILISI